MLEDEVFGIGLEDRIYEVLDLEFLGLVCFFRC